MFIKTDWVHTSNYYDMPISGLVRVQGTYYHFDLEDFGAPKPTYIISEFESKEEKLAYLKRTRSFRHHVGWHCDYKPNQKITRVIVPKKGGMDWFKDKANYDPDNRQEPKLKKVGVSHSLRSVKFEDT